MDEVLAFEREWVTLLVVPTDRQHFAATTLDGYNVWTSNLIVVINTFNKKISVDFVNCVAVIVCYRVATVFSFLLFNVRMIRFWLAKVYVTVESCGLELL